MNIKLDKKDKKILAELENNARQPNTLLSKKVGLPADVIQYRLKRLEKKEIIKEYITYVNIHKLGYIDFGLYLSMKTMSKEMEEKFIQHCKKHNHISYFAKTGGNYSFIIGMLAENILSLDQKINKINKTFGNYIEKIEIVSRVFVIQSPRKYLINRIANSLYFGGELEHYHLDKLDHTILKILAFNAREKIINIAQKLKQPHSTITARIKKLEKDKIITGYHTSIASEKIGYHIYNILVYSKNISEKDEKKLLEFCKEHANMTWIIKTIGKWNYEIGIEVNNQELLQKSIMKLKQLSKDIIKIDFTMIFHNLKYSQYPFNF